MNLSEFEIGKTMKTTVIGLFLMLTIAASLLMALPVVAIVDVEVFPGISVIPNPIGVNQDVLINFWLQPPPPRDNVYGSRYRGYELTIWGPSGNIIQEYTNITSDPLGSSYLLYTPTDVGEYKLQFHYPGEYFTIPRDEQRLECYSDIITLVVQAEPLEQWPFPSLPSDYWERPIAADLKSWWLISGNWIKGDGNDARNNYNPYSTYPTSHIMWTKELQFGGIAGGAADTGYGFGAVPYHTGEAYESKFSNALVIFGNLYYRPQIEDRAVGTVCVDLRTGEERWRADWTYDEGQIFDYESINQGGVHAYLWDLGSSAYVMYDAYTGEEVLRFTNQGGYSMRSPAITWRDNKGSIIAQYANPRATPNAYIWQWNSTKALDENGRITYQSPSVKALGIYGGQYRPTPGSYNWSLGIEYWNDNNPTRETSNGYFNQVVIGKYHLLRTSTGPVNTFQAWVCYDSATGEEAWFTNLTITANGSYEYSAEDGLLMQVDSRIGSRWLALDLDTGKELWKTEDIDAPWGTYGLTGTFAYGVFVTTSYAGKVHAYNALDGTWLWDWQPEMPYWPESPSGLWFGRFGPSAAGMITYQTIMTWDDPVLQYGMKQYALDAYTGDVVWEISGRYRGGVIADGYFAALNLYENQIYCFGMGPSATTVTAPDTAVTLGNSVMIRGTVTDQSPGQTALGIPAAGTPAISDEDMSAWMEYMYMNKPKPEDAQGVMVKLTAIDPNGNSQDLGEVTSDINGNFGINWKPPVLGLYYVEAEFEGSGSYGSSTASTYFAVDEVSLGMNFEQGPTAGTTEATEAPFITTDVAILIAVAVAVAIGIASFWALRKRK